MINMTNLSKQLTLLREKQGWTKRETARRLGLKAPSTYGNWEYGIREPDLSMVKEIASLYDVTVDYLIGDTNTLKEKPQQTPKDIQQELEDLATELKGPSTFYLGANILKPHTSAFLQKNIYFILENAEKINQLHGLNSNKNSK